jgi:DNA-binding winged helix-turn-helix (wHTH) protein
MPGGFTFEGFALDPAERQLRRGGEPVELNGRYFDALELMLRENGRLVTKDRFMDEVWRGVPVTDEALTQCIRTLRWVLSDDAARPRFIETVPKHGYRFIAAVDGAATATPAPASGRWRDWALLSVAGTVGGGFAGLLGGIFYGFAGASQPLQPGMGAISVLLVLMCVTILVALIGGAGVSIGIATAATFANRQKFVWSILGGALGGLVVGAVTKLLGLDAFSLLVGHSPGDITGAIEGAILGGAVGLGNGLASKRRAPARTIALAALCGGGGGLVISLLGRRLMGGSLAILAEHLPGSRLRLDAMGALFGESSFGPIAQAVTATLEGALFAACVVTAMRIARRQLEETTDS